MLVSSQFNASFMSGCVAVLGSAVIISLAIYDLRQKVRQRQRQRHTMGEGEEAGPERGAASVWLWLCCCCRW